MVNVYLIFPGVCFSPQKIAGKLAKDSKDRTTLENHRNILEQTVGDLKKHVEISEGPTRLKPHSKPLQR